MSKPETTRVIIADDHPLMLQGLDEVLRKFGMNVIGRAGDGSEALRLIVDEKPELAILDVEMPYLTGFGIAAECLNLSLPTKFIILSYHKEADFILRAKELNISGYLLKEDTSSEMLKCIEAVMSNRTYFSKNIAKEYLEEGNIILQKISTLSPSEKKILKMISKPLSSQEIAEQLHVSERTIEKHRSNIITKLGLGKKSYGLSLWAREQKTIINSI